MAFKNLMMTSSGMVLYAKAQQGKQLRFSRIAVGDGLLGNGESMVNRSVLKSERASFLIDHVQVSTSSAAAEILTTMRNDDLTEGFYFRELGICAFDSDTQEELLCFYDNAGEDGEYIPAASENVQVVERLKMLIKLENTPNVSFVASGNPIYLTADDIDDDAQGPGVLWSAQKINAAKQDKLTGTAGQVVGFNAEGVAEARSAVLSFNGRTGAVTPKSGDYTVTQVTGAAPTVRPVFTGSISLGRKSGTANGDRSIAAGYNTEASGNFGSSAFGEGTAAIGRATAALGRGSIATGEWSYAEGLWTIADSRAHAEGDGTIAASYLSFLSITDFDYDQRKLVFDSTHRYFDKVFPRLTVGGKIIITFSTWATGPSIYTVKGIDHSTNSITIEEEIPSGKSPSSVVIAHIANEGVANHTEGSSTIAIGGNAHAEGYRTLASGWRSHAEGWETVASGHDSHAAGCGTVAGYYATTAIGTYNNLDGGETPNINKNLFIVGNGQSASSRSNAFRVDLWGSCYGVKAWNSSGADYAELFEWLDKNPNAEDRAGLFVTLEGDRLRLAGPEDDFVLGIVSADPSVVGDVYDDQWAGMYLRDVFGRTIMEMQDFPAETTQVPREDGTMETVELIPARRELAPKLNLDYDHTIKYLPRTQRPEWDAVGMMGKLVAVDDGTCQVNGWCAVGEGGKATHSDARTRYRVMARLDETHIRVLIL